jgi:hypothetical protein
MNSIPLDPNLYGDFNVKLISRLASSEVNGIVAFRGCRTNRGEPAILTRNTRRNLVFGWIRLGS